MFTNLFVFVLSRHFESMASSRLVIARFQIARFANNFTFFQTHNYLLP